MKSAFAAVLAVAAMMLAMPAQASEEAAKKAGCDTCHSMDTKKMGPSYKDIAAKHKGEAGAEAKLVDKLKKASGHPAVKAGDDELKVLVKYVLSR